jgi:hypothetical protein
MLKRFASHADVPLDLLRDFAYERCTATSVREVAARLEVRITALIEFVEETNVDLDVSRRLAQWYVREAEKAETVNSRLVATTRAGVLTLICGICEGPVGVDAFDRDADSLLMEYTCPTCGNGIVKLDPETWENALTVPVHDYSPEHEGIWP